ncbi:MAG: cytochrome P450 [Myxococcales bacterium]|nr:MAG: cytochrome P450 [Myxococcales bacterium]
MDATTETLSGGLLDNVWHGDWERNEKIIDLNDGGTFIEGQPHEKFDELRSRCPVYWNMENPSWGPGFWNITRYDDIVEVSRHPELFKSGDGINIAYPAEVYPDIINAVVGNMICMDPPLHRVYRKIAQPYFSRSRIAGLGGRVLELATGILDEVVERGECDFMADVAAPLPISVLCDILGVPHEDWQLIFDWSNTLIGVDDPELGGSQAKVEATFMELFGYGQKMIEERRKSPREDLMTAIATATPEDGMEIPAHLLNGFFLLMVVAGNETTRNSLSGGMLALCENPDQRQELIDDRSMIENGVEEVLRWVSPVNYMRRTATTDTEIRGQRIAEGDKVVMWYGAANRDPAAFDRPHRFDVTREPNPHIAFGIGEHFCLGARLARLQLQTMFGEVLRRIPDVELAGKVRYVRTNFINGIKEMPVKFTPQGGS